MNERQTYNDQEPCYVISVAARMVGMHAQSLRNYKRMGPIQPGHSQGRVRLYSQSDVERLRSIQRMVQDLGVNLACINVIMNMRETTMMRGVAGDAQERTHAEWKQEVERWKPQTGLSAKQKHQNCETNSQF